MTDETKTKVLLIDDERFLLEIYGVKFLKEGFDVFTCVSVDEALDVLRKGYAADVILLDITMPEKDGYVFLDSIKAEGLAQGSIKIALTNEGQDAEKQRIMELGADAHVLKASMIPSEVVSMVVKMLKEKRGT